jgi:galactokinase
VKSPSTAPNEKVVPDFLARFHQTPQWLASAPGRVNLIGEFTDFNDGFVLPIAIGHRTTIAAAPNHSNRINLWSDAIGEGVSFALHQDPHLRPSGDWSNYVAGVLSGFMKLGVVPRGFDGLISSNVPMGAGLASSAALEVAFATLLEAASGDRLEPAVKARLCQRAEHEFAGVPCGIMDQFIAVLGREGHALLLDCRSQQPTWLPWSDEDISVLIIDSRVKHEHANGTYAQRRYECEAATRGLGVSSLRDASRELLNAHASAMNPIHVRRARHVITEIRRTELAAQYVACAGWASVGELLDESHESLQIDYEASCAELDTLVALAQSIGQKRGVLGCRMTGGGFGGCAVALIESWAKEAIVAEIAKGYRERTGITANFFTSRPAAGAQLVLL